VGIPPAPRGVPQIEVTFDIDANGIVSVSAKDKATGKEQQIRIQASGGLSEQEIQRMIKEAEANAAADKKRREAVEARNHADALIHQTEKTLKENAEKLGSAPEKAAVESAIADLRAVKDGDDVNAIKSRTDALSQAAMKLGELLYRQSQSTPGGDSGAGPGEGQAGKGGESPKDEKVVDADFEDVDDKKKSA
jgi:molecular chaperone DnaK